MNSVSDPIEMAKSASTSEARAPAKEAARGAIPPVGGTSEASGRNAKPVIHFALRADGAILLNAAELKERDLSGRETFTAVVLSPKEMRFVLAHLENAAADVAARLLGALLKSLSRRTS